VATGNRGSESPQRHASRLRERIYVAFTSLAVVIVLATHSEELTARSAAATLFVTALGTVTAAFTAEYMAHLVAHETPPARDELRHLIRTATGALATVVLPLVSLALAGAGIWPLDRALRTARTVLVVTLAAIGFLAVRRVRLAAWRKIVLLLILAALGAAVILLETLAHG
jgi:hypothetical protein